MDIDMDMTKVKLMALIVFALPCISLSRELVEVKIGLYIEAPEVAFHGLPFVCESTISNDTELPPISDVVDEYSNNTPYAASYSYALRVGENTFLDFDLFSQASCVQLIWKKEGATVLATFRPNREWIEYDEEPWGGDVSIDGFPDPNYIGVETGNSDGRLTDFSSDFWQKDTLASVGMGEHTVEPYFFWYGGFLLDKSSAGNAFSVELRDLDEGVKSTLVASLNLDEAQALPLSSSEWMRLNISNYGVLSNLPQDVSEAVALYFFLNSAATVGNAAGARMDMLSYFPAYLEDIAQVLRYEVLRETGPSEEAATLRNTIHEQYPAQRWRLDATDNGHGLIAKAIATRSPANEE